MRSPAFTGTSVGAHDDAADPELRELPVQGVAAGTRFVARPQGLGRPELADQLSHGLGVMRDHTQGADLAGWLGHGDGDRVRMDIQPNDSCTLHG
jgi:hypothetical protein